MNLHAIQTKLIDLFLPGLLQSLGMVAVATVLSSLFGFGLATLLILFDRDGMSPHPRLYQALDTICNIVRSIPFIILAVAVIPFTKLLVGTSIGSTAAVVPLTIIATPYLAKMMETSLREVNVDLVHAARAYGAGKWQVVWRVLVKEATPALAANIIVMAVSILESTAVAGAIGAGGLGAIAITYGYRVANEAVMYTSVLLLVLLVFLLQLAGNLLCKQLAK